MDLLEHTVEVTMWLLAACFTVLLALNFVLIVALLPHHAGNGPRWPIGKRLDDLPGGGYLVGESR